MLARAFARLAWPAFALLVVTGFWNISTFTWSHQSTAWKAVLVAKIVVVVVAGVAVALHQRASSKAQLALWGSRGRPRQHRRAGNGHPSGRVTPN